MSDVRARYRHSEAEQGGTMNTEELDALTERVAALPEHHQINLLFLLVGSNPDDVARELVKIEAAIRERRTERAL